ncbi:cytochrome P450 [Plectosphaerella plurivora]|uniref:Cytochrome P450 n=1 Tax=Plectosphaerella plurivora TaxID=936078 RepID=A0A9P9ABF0_9PEZI|nr:cytochrome P450 [Plectosphaerella plurivora]
MLREIAYTVLGIIVLGFTSEWAISALDDPREPPRLQSRVPLIGHLMGLLQNGVRYYGVTSRRTDAEIYTIGIGPVKIYICNGLHLIPLIQKASKTLSFRPFLQISAKRFGGASAVTQELYTEAFADGFGEVMKTTLAPGPHLDEQNLRMGAEVINQLNKLTKMKEVCMLEWTRHTIVHASSFAVYGDGHPYSSPEVKDAFWEWAEYLPMHLMGIDPLGKGYAARQRVFNALFEYGKKVPANAAKIVIDKSRFMMDAGLSFEETWKQEAAFATALFGNSTPTAFWTFYEIYSRPNILEEIRHEIATKAVKGHDGVFRLDVAAVKTRCHLLLSIYQETQRTRHQHAPIRKVVEDTLLDGRYLLKKGNYLQMPGEPTNMSRELWGASAPEFDPYRFVPKEQKEKVAFEKTRFTAWGAAPHLCPARQFASTEILILVALVVMRVNLLPLNETGRWERDMPSRNELTTLPSPAKELKVRVKTREAWSGTWELEMGTSMTRLSLASG